MAILVMCSNPKCGEMFDAPDDSAGGKVRCSSCGRVQFLAAESPKPAAAAGQPQKPPAKKAAPQKPAATQAAKPAKPSPAPPSPPKNKSDSRRQPRKQQEMGEIDLSPDIGKPAAKQRPADIKLQNDMQALVDNETGPCGEFDELYFPSSGADQTQEMIEPQLPADDIAVLGSKSVAATVLIMGVLGMAVGVFCGIKLAADMEIIAAFIGAGVGWVAGFSLGILLVFVIDKGGSERVHCSICGEVINAAVDTCKWCGSPAPTTNVNPLTGFCLAAGTYARGNMTCLIGLSALAMLVYLLVAAAYHLPREFPAQVERFQPVLIGVAAVVGLFVLGYWMRYLLSVIARTIKGANQAPEAPPLSPLGDIAAAIHSLAVLTVYVGGMFPLPLLPLGLLSMGAPGRRSALGLPWAVRTIGKLVGNYVILWLLIMLWLAVMALGVVLVEALFSLRAMLPTFVEGHTQLIVHVMLSAIKVLCTSVVVGVFLVAVFRCIGMFGRINAATFQPIIPDEKDPRS